jgi:hypothetical protein
MYDDELAFTGLGSIALGGMVFDTAWLVAVAFALIAAGLVLTRLGARSDRT